MTYASWLRSSHSRWPLRRIGSGSAEAKRENIVSESIKAMTVLIDGEKSAPRGGEHVFALFPHFAIGHQGCFAGGNPWTGWEPNEKVTIGLAC